MRLQIVDDDGVVVTIPHYGPLQVEFIDSVIAALQHYPHGLFTSERAVQDAVRQGLRETILTLKAQTIYAR